MSDPSHQQASLSWNEHRCNPAEHQDIRLEISAYCHKHVCKEMTCFHIKSMQEMNLIEPRHYERMTWNDHRFNYSAFTYLHEIYRLTQTAQNTKLFAELWKKNSVDSKVNIRNRNYNTGHSSHVLTDSHNLIIKLLLMRWAGKIGVLCN